MPGSYPYAGKYPTQNERSGIHGISEREKQPDDISEMGCLLFISNRFAEIKEKLKRRCFCKRALGVTETCKKSYYYEYESSFYRMRRRQHEEAARNNRKAGARNKRL